MNSAAPISVAVQELVAVVVGFDVKLLRANEVAKPRWMQLEVEKHGGLGFESKSDVESKRNEHRELGQRRDLPV